MATQLGNQDNIIHLGMDSRTSKVNLDDMKLRLAQNVTYRTIGAITKRNGYTQINNSQVQN
jgi:hypothetical protein